MIQFCSNKTNTRWIAGKPNKPKINEASNTFFWLLCYPLIYCKIFHFLFVLTSSQVFYETLTYKYIHYTYIRNRRLSWSIAVDCMYPICTNEQWTVNVLILIKFKLKYVCWVRRTSSELWWFWFYWILYIVTHIFLVVLYGQCICTIKIGDELEVR